MINPEPPKPESGPAPQQAQFCCTWRPTTAGILNIVAGASGVISGIIAVSVGRLDIIS